MKSTLGERGSRPLKSAMAKAMRGLGAFAHTPPMQKHAYAPMAAPPMPALAPAPAMATAPAAAPMGAAPAGGDGSM